MAGHVLYLPFVVHREPVQDYAGADVLRIGYKRVDTPEGLNDILYRAVCIAFK